MRTALSPSAAHREGRGRRTGPAVPHRLCRALLVVVLHPLAAQGSAQGRRGRDPALAPGGAHGGGLRASRAAGGRGKGWFGAGLRGGPSRGPPRVAPSEGPQWLCWSRTGQQPGRTHSSLISWLQARCHCPQTRLWPFFSHPQSISPTGQLSPQRQGTGREGAGSPQLHALALHPPPPPPPLCCLWPCAFCCGPKMPLPPDPRSPRGLPRPVRFVRAGPGLQALTCWPVLCAQFPDPSWPARRTAEGARGPHEGDAGHPVARTRVWKPLHMTLALWGAG